jgi:hypothetical protein
MLADDDLALITPQPDRGINRMNHLDLFTFNDCFGGEIILDLSALQFIQTKSNGDIHLWLAGDDIVDFPLEEKQRLIDAWNCHKNHIYTTK